MIELRRVSLTYEDRPVLDDVDLVLEEGELVLVSGPTGAGKSSLLGVVTGLVPRFSGGTLRGDVLLDGETITEVPPRERAHVIGHVGQDPAAGFVTDTVEEELAYGMEQLGLPGDTMRRRVEETLDLLGIADLRDRDLRTLSGGQQQRVAIGSVLTSHPRVLVLDEPTSALDPTAAEDVLATITRLVHDLGLTVVLAEHRLERVVPFADRICLLTGDGRVRVGEPADILSTSPVVPPIIRLGRVADWSPLPLTVRDARRQARTLDMPLPAVPSFEPRPVAVTARGLSVVRGRREVLHRVDLTLYAGRVTALMGRNGSGKSTLLWTLQGSQDRRSGSVVVTTGSTLDDQGSTGGPTGGGPGGGPGGATGRATGDGVDPARLSAARRRTHVGLVPQTASDLLYLESVAEECTAADASATPGATRSILDRLAPGIDDDHHPRDLSLGQQLALVLAIVLAARPGVLLLDEPTRGLDYAAKAELARILRDLAADGHAVLVATHDVEFVADVADEVVVLAEGEVVSAGPVAEVVTASPQYAPQVTKVLGAPWLRVEQVASALAASPGCEKS